MDRIFSWVLGMIRNFLQFLFALFNPDRPEIIGIEVVNGKVSMVEEAILPDDLLAYVRTDDKAIYVLKSYEEEVAEELGANVDGNIWRLEEDGALIARERKELQVQDFYNQVAMVKWTYLNGFKCETHPAGFWLNIYRRRSGRFHRSHKTTAAGKWCIRKKRERVRCKLALIEVEGEYWTRPRGRGRRKIEKHKLGGCVV